MILLKKYAPLFSDRQTKKEIALHSLDETFPGQVQACIRIDGSKGKQLVYCDLATVETLLDGIDSMRGSIASKGMRAPRRTRHLVQLERTGSVLLNARNALTMA